MQGKRQVFPRKLPKQARSKATVDAILTAAARILVRDGFDKASTNRIAEVAGVSIGSLYQYFPSKDAIVAALMQRHVDDTIESVSEEFERVAAMPLRDAAQSMVDLMLEAHAVDPELHRALMEQVPHGHTLDHAVAIEQQFVDLARAWLEAHADEVRPGNLALRAFVCVRAVEALTHGAVLHGPERLEDPEFAAEVTDLLVRYLGEVDGDGDGAPTVANHA